MYPVKWAHVQLAFAVAIEEAWKAKQTGCPQVLLLVPASRLFLVYIRGELLLVLFIHVKATLIEQ